MKNFMDENFLLQTETAQKLYHEHAAKMPIIDYHCHLIPQMVADDYQFKSLTEIWLGGDHYKWRAMRTNGVDERFCTGKDTTDWEKFEKWAETVPYTFRNPLYHWTHLELKTAFGIDKILNRQGDGGGSSRRFPCLRREAGGSKRCDYFYFRRYDCRFAQAS